ncbi:FAD-dependent oxidoreductase [Euhalothece natronophila]|uniref:FAD-dependent oxidoreductase n=1 Tax=Euhalothece natronophila TaxID=577489 RepID=UPI001644C75C|nr:FAD-dependent monooxygenase [Euhalothece natronophila]
MACSNFEELIIRPYYIHPVDLPVEKNIIWSSRRIVLAGDAAHGMPPFTAQGTNQGFENALAIVKTLTELWQQDQIDNDEKIK